MLWVRSTFDKASRWSRLRALGNSRLAQATIAIPLLGYLLLFNGYVVDFLKLHGDLCSGCTLPWRLYLFYFGACGIAVGAATYALWCPLLIKNYASAVEYFEREKAFFSHPDNLSWLLDRLDERYQAPELIGQVVSGTPIAANQFHVLAGPMGRHYNLCDTRWPFLRRATLLAYYIGFGLLLIPTGITFVQVLCRAILGP